LTDNDWQIRRDRYHEVNVRLAQTDNRQLDDMLGKSASSGGWGGTHTIKVGVDKVFVKRLLLTELEYKNLFSTANLYDMPTYYNYGVGSAGFGAFRELVTHVKTTSWVLDGSHANFPIMYHYRIVPTAGEPTVLGEERHQEYIRYWGSNSGIDRYIRERCKATHEVIVFLEHFPHVLYHWLPKNLDKTESLTNEMLATTEFLRAKGIIHFDAHFGNIVTDGVHPYLTDYGLALDGSFSLSAEERRFFKRHRDYDDAEFLLCLGSYITTLFGKLSPGGKRKVLRKCGLSEDPGYAQLTVRLQDNLEAIHRAGLMRLDDAYVNEVIKYRAVMQTMHKFFGALRSNDRKDTPFPQAKIRRELGNSLTQ